MPQIAKILVVEDDAHIRRLLSATMARAGHDVVEAADARQAIASNPDRLRVLNDALKTLGLEG